ncbi:hypothetical protein CAPTEDRAFT_220262 [Capitella teleta]|uniref:Pre-mRNA-splicing factor 38 n=1 Tax=Capitella teleta TaxID=283909 RepID=R7TJL4_CAPTE|nr:hypothetical protein CAPTEDRAFT_220262 [Capitella teleta]|eukprot:ELT91290.1 hypothetical protein CAPTEDRAFT_220262 [Capitella teleta]
MAPNNPLPIHGNEKSMNLNHMILSNIQASPYFKVNLYDLKTYHEVIDEIFYKVNHLEPWEKGSRKTAGQTGMCGGVRGVGAGGIVSSAYCLLYKLFTLRLTRKQLVGLLQHTDSPYIRGLGFMYIRYTQPPGEIWDWYVDYLEDEEEIDVRAGGGHVITIGEMCRLFMTKLEWYSTLFPRVPVPIQKSIENHIRVSLLASDWLSVISSLFRNTMQRRETEITETDRETEEANVHRDNGASGRGNHSSSRRNSPAERESRDRRDSRDRHRHDDHRHRRRSSERKKRSRSRERSHRHREHKKKSHDHKHRHRSRSPERKHHHHHREHREDSFERDLRREKDRVRKH